MKIEFQPKPTAHNFIDLTGERYGRLVVLGYAGYLFGCRTAWWCKCDCGTIKRIAGNAMRRGRTTSCGCYAAELTPSKTHGRRKSGAYSSWAAMKTRCTNPNSKSYADYGGRGIKICERWLNSFENFLEDMGERPKGHSIERVDNDGDYEPGNCRWASQRAQVNNTRQNRYLEFDGRSQTISQWAKETGIERRTIARRLGLGWSIERALTEKPVVGKNQFS